MGVGGLTGDWNADNTLLFSTFGAGSTFNRNLKPETRSPKLETQSLKPKARNPKPDTRNLKHGARSPKLETRNPKPEFRSRNP